MSLNEKDIRHVARLAALEIADDDIAKFGQELSDIIDYIDKLSTVPTPGVVPTSHVHGVVNAFRDDVIKNSLPQEEVAENAPDWVSGSFRVPKII